MMQLEKNRAVRYASLLLSFLLVLCAGLPKKAALAAPAAAPVMECACCSTATVEFQGMPVCDYAQHPAGKKPGGAPDGPGAGLLDTRTEAFRRERPVPTLHSAGVQLTGPPLFLKLHRLLN